MDKINGLTEFPVVVYGNLEQYNDVLSKARLRIFYKDLNRNGTYITEEFANKLISSAPYTPVKGIYDDAGNDYVDHGPERNVGRIYGIVPQEPNFAWEPHLDDDGITREYACVDVLLFTGIYEEAKSIVGKSQSMELYAPSIQGEWIDDNGQRAYKFTDGCFLGLQVLGDNVEPCFEGAAFYSLRNSFNELIEKINVLNSNLNIPNNEGGQKMPITNFRLSDNEKAMKIFDLLNPNFNEEHQWEMQYMLIDVYEDYALIVDAENNYQRVSYTKADDVVTLGDFTPCYIMDVTEEEKQALDSIKQLNQESFEKIEQLENSNNELNEKNSEFEQKIEELNTSIATLTTERDEKIQEFTQANERIEALNSEVEELNAYKLQKETEEKESVLNKYSARLKAEVIDAYRAKISEYSLNELDKELAFELVNTNPSIFSFEEDEKDIIPKSGSHAKSSLEALLDRYQK